MAGNPNDVKALTTRGIALGGLGRDRESIAAFEKALKSAPKFVPALQGAVEVSYRSRDPRVAAFLTRLIQVSPDNAVAHAMAGVLAFEGGNCSLAIQHFEHSLTEVANNEKAYPLYGACLLKTQRPLEALKVFERIRAMNPDDTNARFNLGYSQLMAHRPADAVNTLKPLADVPEPDAGVLNLIASAEVADGQWKPAMEHLREAARISPHDERNYVDLAALCIQRDAMEVAATVTDLGLKNVPASARLHSIHGAIQAQLGNTEEAATDFDLANRLDAMHEYGAAGLGLLYTETMRPNLAISVLRERLKKTPNDSMLNYLLAEAIMSQPIEPGTPQFQEARKALAASTRAKPEYTRAHTLLGKLYARVGENEKALEQLKIATRQDPRDRAALSQLAIMLRRLGHTEEAAAVLVDLKQVVIQESQLRSDQVKVSSPVQR
ncbi:MAG: tetratricopeptide repeat protein [Bryobacteraceae bacterium]